MVRFTRRLARPHGHQRSTSVAFRSWKHVDVNMRDFLPGQRTVVETYREVGCPKSLGKKGLDASDPVHEPMAFGRAEFAKALLWRGWNHQSMAFTAWKDIKESVPAFAACNAMRGNFAAENLLKQRRHANDEFSRCLCSLWSKDPMAARPFLEGQRCDVAVLVNGVVVKEFFVGFRVIFSNEGASRLTASQAALDGSRDHANGGLHPKDFEEVGVGDQRRLVEVQGFCSKTDRFQFG